MDKQKQQGKGNKTNSSYLENGQIFTLATQEQRWVALLCLQLMINLRNVTG